MQLLSHLQWWSKRCTHRLQKPQCLDFPCTLVLQIVHKDGYLDVSKNWLYVCYLSAMALRWAYTAGSVGSDLVVKNPNTATAP